MIHYVLISCVSLLFSCSFVDKTELKSQKIVQDGGELLVGEVSKELLFFDFPEWKIEYDTFSPQQGILDSLKTIKKQYSVIVVFGTWCSDSEEEVPRFIKIMDVAGYSDRISYKLLAVDRKKTMPQRDIESLRIEKVATFIFYENNKEIARIIETPQATLEEDILRILVKNE